jgi:anti-sigma regulatory factor (Ser/Thr protein kinase)
MDAVTTALDYAQWIPVEDSSAPGRVRGAAMSLARRLGFSESRIGEVAIAATELGTNLHRHARQGVMLVRLYREADTAAVQLYAIDSGPGIADLPAVIRDGSSTAGTLGIGVGAVLRAASRFDVHSVVDRGTVISAAFWPRAAPLERPPFAGLTRPMLNEHACGDAWYVKSSGDTMTLMVADGLGHGELAAIASRAAVEEFMAANEHDTPATILQHLDARLRHTRGAAVAVIEVRRSRRQLVFCGIGNVAVWIESAGENRRGLHSSPGIVGAHPKRAREIELELGRDATLIVHSDGLTGKWNLNAYAGLLTHAPELIAATLLRDAGIHHDDASIAVLKL